MPNFRFSQVLAANQIGVNPLIGWQYEFVPQAYVRGAACRLIDRSTTTGVKKTIYSGAQTIVQRSPVQGGGSPGVTPSELQSTPDTWIAQPGDRIILQYDETIGVASTVDGIFSIEPL